MVRIKGGVDLLLETCRYREMWRQKPAGCPLTDHVPKDIAANVFANVGSVEISEHRAPEFPRVRVRRCRGA
jgi:hypothetical protein